MWATEWFMKYQIQHLEEENRNLKEKLSKITMVADDEKQSIEHILELEEENKKLKEIIRKNVNGCPYWWFYCSQYLEL